MTYIYFVFFSRLDFLSSFSIERISTINQTQSSYCFAVFFLFVCFFFVYFEISSFLCAGKFFAEWNEQSGWHVPIFKMKHNSLD